MELVKTVVHVFLGAFEKVVHQHERLGKEVKVMEMELLATLASRRMSLSYNELIYKNK